MTSDFDDRLRDISRLFREKNFDAARTSVLEMESEANQTEDISEKIRCLISVSTQLTDIGAMSKDRDMLIRARDYLISCVDIVQSTELGNVYFCLGTAFANLDVLECSNNDRFHDSDYRQSARHYFRLATNEIGSGNSTEHWAIASWINYGNQMRDLGRILESASAYDMALKLRPGSGWALGHRGIALLQIGASLPSYRSGLYAQAKQVLKSALEKKDISPEMQKTFVMAIQAIENSIELPAFIAQRNTVGIQPNSIFETHLFEFVTKHDLWLSPFSSLYADSKYHAGDSIYFAGIPTDSSDPTKLLRYMSFLDEIKNEYVLGRYFLFQSQFSSPVIDSVSRGVEFYKTYDYARYDAYVQLLKSALRQAVGVLDKIANFLYDYCEVKFLQLHQVSFRNVFGKDMSRNTMHDELKQYENLYLFALFTLARDLGYRGDWKSIVDDRNIVTHRFMILHDQPVESQPNKDIPRKQVGDFRNNAIHALQIARCATMYLILFVHHSFLDGHQGGHISGITPIR